MLDNIRKGRISLNDGDELEGEVRGGVFGVEIDKRTNGDGRIAYPCALSG
jgi:hypothetical protein